MLGYSHFTGDDRVARPKQSELDFPDMRGKNWTLGGEPLGLEAQKTDD